MYSAYSAPIFAVSAAITSSGSSMHDPPEDTLPIVLKAPHCATIERRTMMRCIDSWARRRLPWGTGVGTLLLGFDGSIR